MRRNMNMTPPDLDQPQLPAQSQLDALDGGRQDATRFALVCGAIIVLCLALKLPSLFFARAEYDERIYWEVAWNWLNNGRYSLQGMPVLKELPPSVYDRPFFHHPPLLPMLLTPFVAADSPRLAILTSWLGHVLAIIGVAMICWTWRRRAWAPTHFPLWLPVLAVALDPLLTFISRKLWVDGLVGGFGGLALGLVCVAADHRCLRSAIGAGIALGLAALAKLPALLLLPVGVFMVFVLTAGDRRTRFRLAAALVLPACLVVLPWFIVFRAHYGQWLPDWIKPDAALIAASPLVARAMSRPWHYYITQAVLVAPIVLVVLAVGVSRWRHVRLPRLAVPVVWVVVVWLGLMVLRAQGHSVQLRFLTPAVPGLYVWLAALLTTAHPKRSFLPLIALLAVLYGAVYSGFYLQEGAFDEIKSVPEILWQIITRS
jgi:4-amino-4-deoxy-L-arabinose transferase-like glycosyltransferase